MFKKKSALFLFVVLMLVLSSCNLPSGEATPTVEVSDLALKITAQALLLQNSPTPEFTATPELTATPGATFTPSVPTVTVSVNTNCRTGPSVQYDIVDSLLVGQTATVVGKSSSTGYWIIQRVSGGGTCWLFPQYATVSGNTANLPEYPVPPTPTPSKTPTPTATATIAPPAAVTNLVAAKACVPLILPNYQFGGTISWTDNSNNEDGFRIYLGAAPHGTVAANVTTYPIPPVISAAPITLSVEAYNAGGASAKLDIVIPCP
ncbi:MAG: hypothetical protein JNK81_11975 [Anaerolineales bacterium]|nr:hypothetical protein [Anaerolineales bacterium]